MSSVEGLSAYEGFSAGTKGAIERGNALALFPRLQKVYAELAA